MKARQRGDAIQTILTAHTGEGMARTKRLAPADYYIKRLDKPSKRKNDDGSAVLAMFRRMASQDGSVAVQKREG